MIYIYDILVTDILTFFFKKDPSYLCPIYIDALKERKYSLDNKYTQMCNFLYLCIAVLPSLVLKSRIAPPLTRAMTILEGLARIPAISESGVSEIKESLKTKAL